ncbi:hypothetical protein FKW77_003492 [Venturia effusa]|uniref:Uncharacterized protein n=1 Tax=Venturia effusa TaxID=50376 RepID=A0A517KZ88_9PEZI|nr:hypothetical protein FKW77_003492 [Venturia effusa]
MCRHCPPFTDTQEYFNLFHGLPADESASSYIPTQEYLSHLYGGPSYSHSVPELNIPQREEFRSRIMPDYGLEDGVVAQLARARAHRDRLAALNVKKADLIRQGDLLRAMKIKTEKHEGAVSETRESERARASKSERQFEDRHTLETLEKGRQSRYKEYAQKQAQARKVILNMYETEMDDITSRIVADITAGNFASSGKWEDDYERAAKACTKSLEWLDAQHSLVEGYSIAELISDDSRLQGQDELFDRTKRQEESEFRGFSFDQWKKYERAKDKAESLAQQLDSQMDLDDVEQHVRKAGKKAEGYQSKIKRDTTMPPASGSSQRIKGSTISEEHEAMAKGPKDAVEILVSRWSSSTFSTRFN